MSITAGIDVGSTYTKAIVLDSESRILGRRLEPRDFKTAVVNEPDSARLADRKTGAGAAQR